MIDASVNGVTTGRVGRHMRPLVVCMAACALVGSAGLLTIALRSSMAYGPSDGLVVIAALLGLQLTPCVVVIVGLHRSRPLLPRIVVVVWAIVAMLALPIEAVVSMTHSGPERGAILLVVANACALFIAWNSPNKALSSLVQAQCKIVA